MKHLSPTQYLVNRTVGIACVYLLLCGLPVGALAAPVQQLVDMDKVHWELSSDRFRCELELPLKKIGAIAFQHVAGEQLQLVFSPSNRFSGSASIAAATPPWQPAAHSQFEPLAPAGERYQLASDQSDALLRSMDQGLWTLLQLDQKEVVIPTIRWDTVSTAFHSCRESLSPLSVKQARDLTLYYKLGQRALDHEQLDQLEELSRYLKIDNKVTRVLVDAYTDNTGSRIANLQISRERAADVAAALKSGGVSSEIIEQRTHGDRYPSTDNDTPEGRNKNRKVTIRVIR